MMNPLIKPEKLSKTIKKQTVDKLFDASAPSYDFFIMLCLSAIIVSLGLLMSNIAIVIGGMLVAPVLSPIMSFFMGVVVGNFKLMRRSGIVILGSIILVIIISFLITILSMQRQLTFDIVIGTNVNLAYFIIAIVSGAAVAYALVRPKMSEILPGVAISVALIPPLSIVGIALFLAFLDLASLNIAIGAFGVFALNLLGIIFAALAVFAVLKFFEVKDVVEQKLRAEERVIKEEQKEKQKEKIEELEKTVKEATEVIKEKKNGKK